MDFDLDVENYSIDELKLIIHLDKNDDENSINENDLNFAITKSLQKLVHIQELEQEEKNQVQEFYYNIRDRLLKFSREQHKLKTDVSNYKIQNTSTLQPHYVHKNIETTEEGKRKELIKKSLNENKNPYDYQYKGGVFPRNVNYDLNSFKNDIEIDGGLNSVKKKYLTRLINIDSSWRDNEKKSDINNFNFRISPNLKNVLSIRLMSLEIPISWYTFSSKLKNNSFIIKVYNYPTEDNYMNINNVNENENNEIIEKEEFNITIDDGNYTINELIDLLNYKMNYYNDEDKYTPLRLFEWIYDITKNKIVFVIKNTYTIENTSITVIDKLNDTFSYELLFTNKRETLERKAGWILGFRKSSYHVKKNNIYKSIAANGNINYWSIITESFYNPTIYSYIYVCIEDYIQNKYDTITSNIEKNNIDNIALVRISMSNTSSISSPQYHLSSPHNSLLPHNSSYLQYVQFNTNEHIPFCIKREYFGPITLDKLKISIRDQYGNIIPLQQDFSLAIQCELMYS